MHLIIGGDSVVGMGISENWSQNNISHHASTRKRNLVSKIRPYIDFKQIGKIDFNNNYDVIVITAAVTSIYKCEQDPELTRMINVVNTLNAIKKLSNPSTFIVFYSSNQVFDGEKPFKKITDKKKPINEYGKQKSEIEDLLLKYSSNVCIIRMTKILHDRLPLILTWKKNLIQFNKIYPFSDMVFAPIYLDQVITNNLVLNRTTGIHHIPSEKDKTYETLAREICISVGRNENLVAPVKYSTVLSGDIRIPNYTSLA